jgi:RHS repeat-associated protein
MRTAGPSGGAGTVDYLLSDHLGSTSVVTDDSGNVVSSQKYWPYGQLRSEDAITETDRLFTGQRQEFGEDFGDSALALYDYKARFYSTVLGRFVSADSVMPKKNDPVDLDRFAYVRDNPLRYTDPTGHCVGGKDAKCTPSIALNILACAASIEGCAAVNDMLGLGLSIDDIERIHTWAAGAVRWPSFGTTSDAPRSTPCLGTTTTPSWPQDTVAVFWG